MKLTKAKLLETIRLKNEGWTTYQVRKVARISIRRVNQLWTEYLRTGELPEVGRRMGRPTRPLESWEVERVKEAYAKYRVSAATLERLIDRDYGNRIPHNRLHRIMLREGLARAKGKKDVRKKDWIRYERRHSLTAVHIDWHTGPGGIEVFGVEDDASRKLLALIESGRQTVEWSIKGMEEALAHGPIRQCISDHGSQFSTQHIDGDSRFQAFLKEHQIKPILCRVKHPQSNGKIEKWFGLYDRHRQAFQTREEFLRWYNEVRPHRGLDFENLETPEQAFQRKMRRA